jgi:hypothetical protein
MKNHILRKKTYFFSSPAIYPAALLLFYHWMVEWKRDGIAWRCWTVTEGPRGGKGCTALNAWWEKFGETLLFPGLRTNFEPTSYNFLFGVSLGAILSSTLLFTFTHLMSLSFGVPPGAILSPNL